jgi:hypothetical protein
MRVSELLTYFLGICLAVAYGLQEFLICFILAAIIILVVLIGAIVEGLRLFQWFFLVAFTAHLVLIIMDVYSVVALAIYCTFLGISIILTLLYGQADFSKVRDLIDHAPYQVAHRDIYSSKDNRSLSAWYPMDKEEYNKTIGSNNSDWLRYGELSREGVARATADWGTDNHMHPWFYKYIDRVKMDTVEKGQLSQDFLKSDQNPNPKKLIPIIHCHGLTCSRTSQSVSCRDLASHGYIVFSIDHYDGTANFSVLKNGENKYWSSKHDPYDKELRTNQIRIRRTEV